MSCSSRSVQGLESSLVGTMEVTRERETEKRERLCERVREIEDKTDRMDRIG